MAGLKGLRRALAKFFHAAANSVDVHEKAVFVKFYPDGTKNTGTTGYYVESIDDIPEDFFRDFHEKAVNGDAAYTCPAIVVATSTHNALDNTHWVQSYIGYRNKRDNNYDLKERTTISVTELNSDKYANDMEITDFESVRETLSGLIEAENPSPDTKPAATRPARLTQ